MGLHNKEIVDGKDTYVIGRYKVVVEGKNFTGIYDEYNNLVTSKENRNQAVRLAKLLNRIYKEGYSDAREVYYEDAWRD